ncbi:NUDIX domain-containing protein [Gordonia sp. NPDC003425]
MTRRILGVGAVVHDEARRLLLVRRAREPQAGRWSVPGGKVEAGESLRDAVIREVLEETGIEIEVGAQVWVVDIPDGRGGVFEVHDFVGYAVGGRLAAGDDAADAGWFDVETMRALPLTDGLIEHLAAAGLLAGDVGPRHRIRHEE